MKSHDEANLIKEAGAWGAAVIEEYRAESPDKHALLAQAHDAGVARFDLSVRDLTGFAPTVELVAVVGEMEQVIASQVFRRRDKGWRN